MASTPLAPSWHLDHPRRAIAPRRGAARRTPPGPIATDHVADRLCLLPTFLVDPPG
jgi:hypothetical protein